MTIYIPTVGTRMEVSNNVMVHPSVEGAILVSKFDTFVLCQHVYYAHGFLCMVPLSGFAYTWKEKIKDLYHSVEILYTEEKRDF